MIARQAYVEGPFKVSLRERDLSLGDDEVLVKTNLGAICGTDKNVYLGALNPAEHPVPGFIGHEGGGTVVAVGARVREYRPGDKVFSMGWNGTLGDYFTSKVHDLHPVPAGLSLDVASLGNPLTMAIYAGLHSGVEPGDTVAIFGLGFAGQVIQQMAMLKGAKRVVAVDVADGKLEAARQLGAAVVVNATRDDPVAAIRDVTGGRGADVVVEAAGVGTALQQATSALKHSGILVLYGHIAQPFTMDFDRWHEDGFDVRVTTLGHHSLPHRVEWTERALRPLLEGMLKIEPLVTHEFKLEAIEAAFATAAHDPSAIKVVVRP